MRFRNSSIYFFLVNFLLATVLIYGLTLIAFRWLATYTRHGIYVKVPNLFSLDLKQALVYLDRKGLQYDVDTTRYDPAFKPYKIFVYVPEAGDYVKPGRRIFIRANASGFQPVILPEILQVNECVAFKKLFESNILIKKVNYFPDIPKSIVFKVLYKGQEVHPGASLPYKAKVDLFIGLGYKKGIPVPDLSGMSLASVKKILQEKKFLLGEVIYDDFEKTQGAHVYRQYPLPDQIYNEGNSLNIWLSNATKSQLDSLILKYKTKKEVIVLSEDSANPSVINKKKESSISDIQESVPLVPDVPLDEDIIIE